MLSQQATPTEVSAAMSHRQLLEDLSYFFAVEFSVWEGSTGELIHPSLSQPVGDQLALASLVQTVDQGHEPRFVFDADGVLALAIPLVDDDDIRIVATAWFVTRDFDLHQSLDAAAPLLSMSLPQLGEWACGQEVWSAQTLLRMAEAVRGKRQAEATSHRTKHDLQAVSQNLASTYEEISLLHAVTQNLRISSTEGEIGQMATDWLNECVPAEALAVQYVSADDREAAFHDSSDFYVAGDCPVTKDEFTQLVETLGLRKDVKPYIANEVVTAAAGWLYPRIRQLIVVPLSEGNRVFGWLAAFNHEDGLEFGTVEAQLLNSLGALLGIHSSNRLLYREQADFVANVVRALVSAIDAKDPYTSGHSDRVSRVAVRIALELRCGPKVVNTIYMAGLLHDVGKIGIDDNVLRKAGRLTDQEFEHIKLHPEMGYRIIADLKQLSDVQPAVLHHHEQWDGGGYPHGLQGEEIPLMARIMAVADAYDAMTSDRPYRRGMDEEKVDQIFRDGSGKQWDPEVVAAFFVAKSDIMAISQRDRAQVEEHWV